MSQQSRLQRHPPAVPLPDQPANQLSQDPSLADLRGAALACLLVMGSSSQPAKLDRLRQAGGYGRDATGQGLNTLAGLGLVCYDPGMRAWLLTEAGRNYCARAGWLAAGSRSTALEQDFRPPEKPSPGLESRDQLPGNQGAGTGLFVEAVKEENPLKESLDSKDFLKTINIDSSRLDSPDSPTVPSPQDPSEAENQVDVARLLEACADLFGEPLLGSPAGYSDTRRLLAVIAETYHNRDQLRKPARVAYTAYQQGRIPHHKYLDDPLRFLPASLLQRIGMRHRVGSRGWASSPEAGSDDEDEPRSSPAAPYRPVGPYRPASVTNYFPPPPPDSCGPGIEPELARRWYLALLQLKDATTPVQFATYMVDLILLECDPENGLIKIGCRDAQCLAWLETCLKIKIQRLMSGVFARELQVMLVVWPGSGSA